jgi:hypothetical protein
MDAFLGTALLSPDVSDQTPKRRNNMSTPDSGVFKELVARPVHIVSGPPAVTLAQAAIVRINAPKKPQAPDPANPAWVAGKGKRKGSKDPSHSNFKPPAPPRPKPAVVAGMIPAAPAIAADPGLARVRPVKLEKLERPKQDQNFIDSLAEEAPELSAQLKAQTHENDRDWFTAEMVCSPSVLWIEDPQCDAKGFADFMTERDLLDSLSLAAGLSNEHSIKLEPTKEINGSFYINNRFLCENSWHLNFMKKNRSFFLGTG